MLRSKQTLIISALISTISLFLLGSISSANPSAGSESILPAPVVKQSTNDEAKGIGRPHLLWKFKSKGSFFSAPEVSGEMVIVGDAEGTLSCLSAEDGDKVWSRSFSGYFAASPVIADNRVYIAQSSREVIYNQESGGGIFQSAPRVSRMVEEDGAVRCLDLRYGRRRWKRNLPRPVHSSPVLEGDRVIVGCLDHKIYCLDRSTGTIIWDFKTDGPVESSPAVEDGMVLAGSRGGSIYCLDLKNGEEKWRFGMGKRVVSTPVCRDGMLFVGADNGEVYSILVKTGRPAWQIGIDGVLAGSPIVTGRYIYAGTTAGKLYCLRRKDGREVWSQKLSRRIISSPQGIKGGILVSTDQGVICCLDPADGTVKWKYNLFSGSTAWMTSDGDRIYAASSDRKVYCLGE